MIKLKEENKIALVTIGVIYVVFMVVKTVMLYELSWTFHIISSVVAVFVVLFFGLVVKKIDFYLDKVYPFERSPIRRITLQFLITLAVVLLVRTIPYFVFYDKFPYHPSKDLLVATYAVNVFMVLSVILSIFGYHFFVRWKHEKIVAAELDREKTLVQYDNLKNQLNPHFLFNALSSLNSLIFENPQLASDFLQQLSKVYRYVLENKEKNTVSLQTELNFVGHYIKLLETRFGDGLLVKIDVTDDVRDKTIIPVTLQILLENAVKHNIISSEFPLTIRIYNSSNFVSVENNLQRKSAIETSNKQGLENLKNLYQYIAENPLIVEETNDTFKVTVPLS